MGVCRAGGDAGCEHDPVRARPSPTGIVGAGLAAVGLVLIAVGTFLPWFRSGAVLRNSYDTIGIARTLRLDEGSPLEAALDAWTMIIPLITVCIVTYAFGFRRTAATISAIVAIVCGTVGGLAAVQGGSETPVSIAGTGPTVTLIGGALALLGVIGVFAGRRARVTTNAAGGEP